MKSNLKIVEFIILFLDQWFGSEKSIQNKNFQYNTKAHN